MSEQPVAKFQVEGYTLDGFKVSLTLPLSQEMGVNEWLDYIRKTGIVPREPSMTEGEQPQTVRYLMRFNKIEDDGSETPVICLYDERSLYGLKAYLNTEEHIVAMQAATGIHPDELPIYPGNSGLEKGKNPKLDKEYLVRLPAPLTVYKVENPRYDKTNPEQMKINMIPQWKFSRWGTMAHPATTSADTPPTQSPANDTSDASKAKWWNAIMGDKELQALFKHTSHFVNTVNKMYRNGELSDSLSAQLVKVAIIQHVQEKAAEHAPATDKPTPPKWWKDVTTDSVLVAKFKEFGIDMGNQLKEWLAAGDLLPNQEANVAKIHINKLLASHEIPF